MTDSPEVISLPSKRRAPCPRCHEDAAVIEEDEATVTTACMNENCAAGTMRVKK